MGKIAIGKEFDRFRLLRIGEEQGHILLLRPLQKQIGKYLSPL